MNGQPYAVILVYSTGHALRAEEALAEAGIPCKLIPVPRYLSSGCGMCIRVAREEKAAAIRVLEPLQLAIGEAYDI